MQDSIPQKSYYLKVRPFVLAYIAFLDLFLIYHVVEGLMSPLWLIVGGVATLGMLLTYQIHRIETSPASISYHLMGLYSIVTPWSNVERIAMFPLQFHGIQRVLILKEKVQVGALSALEWGIPKEYQGKLIPLRRSWGWGNFESLAHDIRTYAPHAQGLELLEI
jgi:hypothetical protein